MKSHSFNEVGTFTIWALGLCLLLFLLGGVSIDIWRAFEARRSLNEIADTASRAGASEIDVRQRQLYSRVVLDAQSSKNAAHESIQANAALQNIQIDSETVNIDAAQNEVNIEITSTFRFFLLRMLPGTSDSQIVVRSSARPFEN